MEKLLLVGANGFGRVVLEHSSLEYEYAFLDDVDVAEVNGTPVVGKIDDILREKIYKRAEKIGYTCSNIIVLSAYISLHASIGTSCVILNNKTIQR